MLTTNEYIQPYRDREISNAILSKIKKQNHRPLRLMEVCGTHTVSIFRSGIRGMLPETISLLSGPGCPVCVTSQQEIDRFIALSRLDDVIITTFGDLIRVPGTDSSLQMEQANGGDIRVVYSPLDALKIAKDNPHRRVIFLGVGFETTAPTIAASMQSAGRMQLDNYFVYSAHKLIPPALEALLGNEAVRVDGFILPGHVSVVIGERAYRPIVDKYQIPCVIAGFEPLDMLQAVLRLTHQIENDKAVLENVYERAVTDSGNETAQKILKEVFEVSDATWRGIGRIEKSGLKIRDPFSAFDATKIETPDLVESTEPRGCECGKVLMGLMIPPECPLYQTVCTPASPIGPCMVSSEGTCAAYYRYYSNDI